MKVPCRESAQTKILGSPPAAGKGLLADEDFHRIEVFGIVHTSHAAFWEDPRKNVPRLMINSAQSHRRKQTCGEIPFGPVHD